VVDLSLTSSTIGLVSNEATVIIVVGGVLESTVSIFFSLSVGYTRRVVGCCKRCCVPRVEYAESGRSTDAAK
jgi:hypothetical protein